jgi:hypothetical protein
MPKRIAVNSIVVYRDGKRFTVKPDQMFDFTDAELADIKRSASDAVRQPTPENAVVEVKLPGASAPAGGKGSGGRGGNKTQQQAAEQADAPKADATGDDEI